ncbi:MAG: type II toxin-antitoxin system HicB family antitoxin [Solirubrobacteraceae bacterium]
MELTVVVHRESDGFWSEVAELPGCFASGPTLGELRDAVGEAVGLYLWDVPVALDTETLGVGETPVTVRTPGPGE